MKKVRFGIVGLGNQGSYYTKGLFAQDKIENGVLTAVCDWNPTKLDAVKEALEGKNVACTHREIENEEEETRKLL